jgi:hypothetical protein
LPVLRPVAKCNFNANLLAVMHRQKKRFRNGIFPADGNDGIHFLDAFENYPVNICFPVYHFKIKADKWAAPGFIIANYFFEKYRIRTMDISDGFHPKKIVHLSWMAGDV